MNDNHACATNARGAVAMTAALLLSGLSGAAVAAPSHSAPGQAPADASTVPPGERLAVQALARSILSRLPVTGAAGGACAPPTLDSLRAAVTDAIGQTDPSREVALAALALAHQQAPQSAACVLTALDDTSDELDGSGATVDDSGKVRGFTLYMGPLPPFAQRVSNP